MQKAGPDLPETDRPKLGVRPPGVVEVLITPTDISHLEALELKLAIADLDKARYLFFFN